MSSAGIDWSGTQCATCRRVTLLGSPARGAHSAHIQRRWHQTGIDTNTTIIFIDLIARLFAPHPGQQPLAITHGQQAHFGQGGQPVPALPPPHAQTPPGVTAANMHSGQSELIKWVTSPAGSGQTVGTPSALSPNKNGAHFHYESAPSTATGSLNTAVSAIQLTTSGQPSTGKIPALIREFQLSAPDDKEWQSQLFGLLQNQTYNQCEVDLFELMCKVIDQSLFAQVDWARNSIFFKDLKVCNT